MPLQMQGPQAPQKAPQFTEDQILAISSFVQSEAPGPTFPSDHILDGKGDVSKGAELFRVNCAMCHNVAAAGGALTEGKYAPGLSETSALHMYAAMVTGPQNMPVFGDMNCPTKTSATSSRRCSSSSSPCRSADSRWARSDRSPRACRVDLRYRRTRRRHRVDHGEVQLTLNHRRGTYEEHHGTTTTRRLLTGPTSPLRGWVSQSAIPCRTPGFRAPRADDRQRTRALRRPLSALSTRCSTSRSPAASGRSPPTCCSRSRAARSSTSGRTTSSSVSASPSRCWPSVSVRSTGPRRSCRQGVHRAPPPPPVARTQRAKLPSRPSPTRTRSPASVVAR